MDASVRLQHHKKRHQHNIEPLRVSPEAKGPSIKPNITMGLLVQVWKLAWRCKVAEP